MPSALRLPRDRVRGGACDDQFAQRVGDGHQLMHAHASAIADAVARRAAARLERAEAPSSSASSDGTRHASHSRPHQPLRGDEPQRRRQVVRRDADVDQPRDGGGRVVRVQRREHEMAGLRGLHGDVGGLGVADFADHDHVRVLTHERPQRDGESEPGLVAHADLIDAGQLDLGRDLRPNTRCATRR